MFRAAVRLPLSLPPVPETSLVFRVSEALAVGNGRTTCRSQSLHTSRGGPRCYLYSAPERKRRDKSPYNSSVSRSYSSPITEIESNQEQSHNQQHERKKIPSLCYRDAPRFTEKGKVFHRSYLIFFGKPSAAIGLRSTAQAIATPSPSFSVAKRSAPIGPILPSDARIPRDGPTSCAAWTRRMWLPNSLPVFPSRIERGFRNYSVFPPIDVQV